MLKTFEIKGSQIGFAPVNAGTYTHRIIINGQASKHWLSEEYKPSKEAAKYFYTKHFLGIDNPTLLEKAIKKEKQFSTWSKEAFMQWLLDHQFEKVGETGNWRNDAKPLERYIKEMKDAGKWKEGQFNRHYFHTNRMRWMERFNNYIESLSENECYGIQVYTLFQNAKDWDNKKYDIA